MSVGGRIRGQVYAFVMRTVPIVGLTVFYRNASYNSPSEFVNRRIFITAVPAGLPGIVKKKPLAADWSPVVNRKSRKKPTIFYD